LVVGVGVGLGGGALLIIIMLAIYYRRMRQSSKLVPVIGAVFDLMDALEQSLPAGAAAEADPRAAVYSADVPEIDLWEDPEPELDIDIEGGQADISHPSESQNLPQPVETA
jgi:hypothetical protein